MGARTNTRGRAVPCLSAALLAVALGGGGCAARSEAVSRELSSLRDRVAELEAAHQRDTSRFEDLSTRLVALEATPARARPELPVVRVRPARPAREAAAAADAEVPAADETYDDAADGARPVLRLDESSPGHFAASSGGAPRPARSFDLAAVGERLPVVPIASAPGAPPLDATAALDTQELDVEAAPAGPPVEEVVAEARAQAQRGDCGAVLEALGRVIGQSPEHPLAAEAMLLRAQCHRRRGEHLRAIGELERLARRYPGNGRGSDALSEMAEAYAALGDADRAREIFGEIMRRYPRSRAASRATARVQELGRGARAREER